MGSASNLEFFNFEIREFFSLWHFYSRHSSISRAASPATACSHGKQQRLFQAQCISLSRPSSRRKQRSQLSCGIFCLSGYQSWLSFEYRFSVSMTVPYASHDRGATALKSITVHLNLFANFPILWQKTELLQSTLRRIGSSADKNKNKENISPD